MLHGVLNFIRLSFSVIFFHKWGKTVHYGRRFLVADVPISEYLSVTIIYIEPR